MLLYQWALIDNLSPLNGRHIKPSGQSVRGAVYSMQMHLNSRAIAEQYQYKRQPSLLGDNTAEGPAGTLAKWDDRGGTRCPYCCPSKIVALSVKCVHSNIRFLFEVASYVMLRTYNPT